MRKEDHKKLKSCLLLIVSLLLTMTEVYSQESPIPVRGKITDDLGNPLNGVTVYVKNQNIQVMSNENGRYTIEALPTSTLVFSYVGYTDQEISVNTSGVMNVVMSSEGALDEVVVIGYGTARKRDLTGGLSVVGQKELSMVSTTNLMDRLVGQVAGLNITSSNAAPGASQSLLIRGENSISANNSPLIILDGIPYSGSLVDLDPNIIENLTVLKDASAVAIYGSRGSNGVILIQTKRGMVGKPQVGYRGLIGLAEPMQYIQVMGPNEFIRMKQDIGRLRRGLSGDQLDPIAGDIISQSERENYVNGITHNWQDYIFRTGLTMDHQLNFSGGTSTTKYMVAASSMKQEGVVYNSQLSRTNVSANIDQVFNEWLTTGIGTQFIQREDGGITPNIEHGIKQSPYGKYLDEVGRYVTEPMEYSLITNPMLNVNGDQDRTNRNFFINGYANILLPVEGLSFRSSFGYNYRSNFTGTYYGRDTFIGREQAALVGGNASVSNAHSTDYTWENVMRYDIQREDHRFDATGLFSLQQFKNISSGLNGQGFVTDNTSYYMMGAAERNQTISSRLEEEAMLSYMLRLNYGYKGRYLATVTGRVDGASVFGANNKYAFFPSVALAWNVAEENFVKDNMDWMDMFKIRLSYGANGNNAIPRYRTLNRLYTGVRYLWGDGGLPVNTAYLASDGVGNPNLRWETTYSTNLGLDFQFLNNRLGGTVEMYLSNTHDLLMIRTVPMMNGFGRIWDNIGQTRNKGIEVALNSVNIRKSKFEWSSNLNFSLNRDKIIELRGDQQDDINNNWFIGKPLRVVFDYNVTGIWQQGDEFSHTDADGNVGEIQRGAKAGDAKLEDVDGDGFITSDDRKIIGSRMPRYLASLGNRMAFGDVYFSFLVNGVFGVWREDNLANMGSWTYGITNYVRGANYWTPENPDADIVSPGYLNSLGHGYYRKQDYVQLKNVTLGYRMRANLAGKVGLNAIDVNVSVNNVHTFSNARQVLNYDNGWMASYPTARSYMLGLNLTF